jgi:hypothetical protein
MRVISLAEKGILRRHFTEVKHGCLAMPRIFGNIEQSLLPALRETIQVADRADFCVGYFNLRGWKQLDSHIEKWSGGKGHCRRLLIGMQRLPQDELRAALSLIKHESEIDNQTAIRLKTKLAEEFRDQLSVGILPNGACRP